MSAKGRECLRENEEACFGKASQKGAPQTSANLSVSETTVRVGEEIVSI